MKYAVALFFSLLLMFPAQAQLTVPAASPGGMVKQKVGLNEITIEYSRPGVKGRKIFGGLLPYGRVWRTGANARTKLTLAGDAMLADKKVEAGSYGVFTIPGEEKWVIILSKDYESSAGAYTEANDYLRFSVKPERMDQSVETLTFNVTNISTDKAVIELVWENTRIAIPFYTEVDEVVMKQIKEATAGVDPMVYYRSAMYYYDNDKDLEQAAKWVDLALEGRKTFWMMHGKAKILAKMDKKDEAIKAAKQSMELAEEAGSDSYVDLNKKLIESIK